MRGGWGCTFLLGQKKSTKRKPLFTWRLPGADSQKSQAPWNNATKSNRKIPAFHRCTRVEAGFSFASFLFDTKRKEGQDLLYFSFGSKEKYQKKTTIYLAVDGGGLPKKSSLMEQRNKKQQKIPAFHRCTRVEAGFSFVSFLFYKKRKENRLAAQNLGRSRFFFCFFSF